MTLISYDRATFQGSKTYYVSFNNEAVGELIGNGFLSCVTSWGDLEAAGVRAQRR